MAGRTVKSTPKRIPPDYDGSTVKRGGNKLVVKIKTLTPLYTGGIDGTMDRIHETGILGSLRWWYEAIVRGLGGWACDPTTDGRCPDNEGNYCDVCAVFGATGLQRAFRMEGPVWWNEQRDRRLTIKVRGNRGWFLGRGFMGQADLKFIPLRLPEGWAREDLWQSLLLIWTLIARWGGLGPKTQQGYGVVQADFNGKTLNVEQALQAFERLKKRSDRREVVHNDNRPSLDGFFLTKARFDLGKHDAKEWLLNQIQKPTLGRTKQEFEEESRWYLEPSNGRNPVLPQAPVVRYYLRGLIKQTKHNSQWVFSHNDRHLLMGEQGRKSLIHVSHAYPVENNLWEFRIWGWIPEQLPDSANRSTVLQHLRRWLGVSQERIWHKAQTNNETLWHRLQMQNVQVCWFTKGSEKPDSYLRVLLNGCEYASSRGGSGSEG